MIKQKINNESVIPVKVTHYDEKKILGYDIWPTCRLYGAMYIAARKQSGKTSVINHILSNCVSKDTHVFVFCPTNMCDPTWIQIHKNLDKKGIPNSFFDSIVDNGVDQLQLIVQMILDEIRQEEENKLNKDDSDEDKDPLCGKGILIDYTDTNGGELQVKIKKSRSSKKKACKYFFIFDDIAPELKRTSVDNLVKLHRHSVSKVIISSQYLNDLLPSTRSQIDSYILFRGLDKEKLEETYRYGNFTIPYQLFDKFYHDATEEKYNFFYCTTNNEYRHNFDKQYKV